jgi:dihydrofolate synthase/folylpolyglutamate synthase
MSLFQDCHLWSINLSKLLKFLEEKPLYYKEIDYDRMPRVWSSIKDNIKLPKVVHIVGTNGKGSTGRFLATYLYKIGKRVLHYSSPHILEFNERIWIDGKNVDYSILDEVHLKLLDILGDKVNGLSYFEYTTLIAIYLSQDVDYLILEAGLGGELDATNVVENDLSLITPIGFDHQAFLGDTIQEIATTKLKSIDNRAIVATQEHKEVYRVLEDLNKEYSAPNDVLTKDDLEGINNFIIKNSFASYLTQNLALAMSVVKYFGYSLDLTLIDDIKLFGRCQKIAPNITVDVGHNPLAAKVIAKEFANKKIDLIYNTFSDKDYREVLKILKPIINKVLIIDVDDSRVEKRDILESTLNELKLNYSSFDSIESKKDYLVFGSFSVVERFLKTYRV